MLGRAGSFRYNSMGTFFRRGGCRVGVVLLRYGRIGKGEGEKVLGRENVC